MPSLYLYLLATFPDIYFSFKKLNYNMDDFWKKWEKRKRNHATATTTVPIRAIHHQHFEFIVRIFFADVFIHVICSDRICFIIYVVGIGQCVTVLRGKQMDEYITRMQFCHLTISCYLAIWVRIMAERGPYLLLVLEWLFFRGLPQTIFTVFHKQIRPQNMQKRKKNKQAWRQLMQNTYAFFKGDKNFCNHPFDGTALLIDVVFTIFRAHQPKQPNAIPIPTK